MSASLAKTVDHVNETLFYQKPIDAAEGNRIVLFIRGRLGLSGSYEGMPAPSKEDLRHGIRLFTGDTPSPRSARHILGEEACRAVLLLAGKKANTILEPAWERMGAVLDSYDRSGKKYPDLFCCPKCTCGLLRHLSAGGLPKQWGWLEKGLSGIRSMRDGKGGWNMFPFHYTLFTLLDIDLPAARKELAYAARRCEKEAAGRFPKGMYPKRRLDVMLRVLSSGI
jgi:hypothetical protein